MLKKITFIGFLVLLTNLAIAAQSADVGIKTSFAGGEVASVDSAKIVLQTKDGVIEVTLAVATEYKRIPPETPTLKAAVAAAFADVGVGDKLLVTGAVSSNKKQIPAKTIYILSKSDIAQKNAKEAEAWQKRGITGRATKIDFQNNQVTVAVREVTGEKEIVVSPNENAKFLRYAPNSIKYSEAKSSNLKEIFVGDIVRALGDKSEDGVTSKPSRFFQVRFKPSAEQLNQLIRRKMKSLSKMSKRKRK